jgi:hypothetical protein
MIREFHKWQKRRQKSGDDKAQRGSAERKVKGSAKSVS